MYQDAMSDDVPRAGSNRIGMPKSSTNGYRSKFLERFASFRHVAHSMEGHIAGVALILGSNCFFLVYGGAQTKWKWLQMFKKPFKLL
jgi:hypothetical protein